MTDLEDRLREHFDRTKNHHRARAKKAGTPINFDFPDLLAAVEIFGWKCPLCDRSLSDLPDWHICHAIYSIKKMGNTIVFISCPSCNRIMREYHDDPDLYFPAYGKDSGEFWAKVKAIIIERRAREEKILNEIYKQPAPILKETSNLVQKLLEAAENLKKK